ncbi:hypothetical protein O8C83_05820 [Aliarcobacter butzleri]|uniref:hypothetical protein n=1 Tax=Aliarcobacter butzleri TaxID=28197 RepID=UPI00263EA08A|nr:hypothetical protein [Aliarcobacter butzleri]MDN5100334.1 hypothetical protein [Aliarcobacter butzleri]
MEFIKDFLGIFLNIYTYYIEAIRFVFGLIISNKSYLDFFMIYTANIIPVLFLFKRIVDRTLFEVFCNITVHIYVFAMTGFTLMIDKEFILRDINGDTTESARLLFIWAIFSLFGIQSMAHKVSVRVIARNRAKKYEKEMEE